MIAGEGGMRFENALKENLIQWLAESRAEKTAAIMAAALDAVDPRAAVMRALERSGSELRIAGQVLDLDAYQRIKVLALGKAAHAMTQGLLSRLDDRIDSGLVICKYAENGGFDELPDSILVVQGDHPVPGAGSIAAGRSAADLLAGGKEDDLVVCLISGGGSALVTLPQEGVSLEDLQALTRELLACGAAIEEINCLRKHLDQVKGGGVVRMAAPARVVTLVLSDVVGSPLDVIASGPTVADPTSFADALEIVEKYHLTEKVPTSILQVLQKGAEGHLAENPKPGDVLVRRVSTSLVGDNGMAARAAVREAKSLGFTAHLVTTFLQGEAREAGGFLAAILRQIVESGEPFPRPVCLVFGGETTVTLRGKGKGGRNQELALGAASGVTGLGEVLLAGLGTDGDDGPTDAAGAFVTGEMVSSAVARGLDPEEYLANNDAYHFFSQAGGLLVTGPTGTNVNDLAFIIVF